MKEQRRRAVRAVGFVLIVAAVGVIGYAGWNLISTEIQTRNSLLEAEQVLGELDSLAPATAQPGADATAQGAPAAGQGGAAQADATAGRAPSGRSTVTGLLIFDSLGGRKVAVRDGTGEAELSSGAARHPRSSQPGGANCVVYGHRNTVFRGFGELKPGDSIRYEVKGAAYTYRVVSAKVIEPGSKEIFAAHEQPVLTLVTCYPFNYVGSAPQRYLVVAALAR